MANNLIQPSGVNGSREIGAPSSQVLGGEDFGFVALSKFVVANGMMAEVKAAFRERPHLVDGAPGFQRLEVMIPRDNPDELWLVTYWDREESYRVWHRGHDYHAAHKGIPKGLKLDARGTSLRLFDVVCR